MSDKEPKMQITSLIEWFNEHQAETDRDHGALEADIRERPLLHDPRAVLKRQQEIGRIDGRRQVLIDFKGLLIANSVIEVEGWEHQFVTETHKDE